MEVINSNVCLTCLGSIELPIDLFEPCYKDYLDILQRLLGLQLFAETGRFIICRHCQGKIVWVSEFQVSCLKSLHHLGNVPYKLEVTTGENQGVQPASQTDRIQEIKLDQKSTDNSGPDDNYSDASDSEDEYVPENSLETRKTSVKHTRMTRASFKLATKKTEITTNGSSSHVDDNIESQTASNTIKTAKKRKQTDESKNETEKTQKIGPKEKVKRLRLQQFPANEVLEAIEDSRSYLNDAKNRQCVLCDYFGADAANLQLHIGRKHEKEFKKWCKHCNIVTKNLEDHRDSTKCYEQKCKFCGDTFTVIKYLKQHLQQHCRTELFQPAIDKLENRASYEPCEQYPEDEVEQAITDCSAFMTDLKNRTCLYCDFLAPNSRKLSIHLSVKHKEEFKNWCSRCNKSNDDLQLHMKTSKCSENRCVFCNKMFSRVHKLIEHLKSHCEESNEPIKITRGRRKNKVKPLKLKQYPASKVLEAIEDARSYLNDVKNRQCVVCDYIGADAAILQLHIVRKHEEEFKTWCKHCNIITKNLQEHKDSVKCYEQKCILCGDTFPQVKYLKVHLQQHCREELFQPAVDKLEKRAPNEPCEQFPESEVVKAIVDCSAYITDIKNRTCLYCEYIATTSRKLSLHLSVKHKDEFINWCSRCNLASDDLQSHIKTSKCTENRCIFCNKVFSRVHLLTMHLRTHCLFSDLRALCKKQVCGVKYSDLKDKSLYVKQKRTRRSSNTLCPVCGKMFINNGLLKVHMRKCTGEKAFKCSYCEKLLTNKTYLRIHEARHTGARPHLCPICEKGSATKGDLKRHMEIHEGGPVTCTICNKEFNRPGVLALHMKRHTGENPFKCVQCEMSYHRASLLKNHMRSHSNERPFKCSFCDNDFSCKTTLRKHENIHKGIKPYKCSICSFSCVQASGLSIHMKQHPEDLPQSDRPYKCLYCYRQFDTNAMLMSHTNNLHMDKANRE